MSRPKRVLILGAYGLIGAHIVSKLRSEGCEVIGLVRSQRLAKRLLPGVACRFADISKLVSPDDWRNLLADIDVVVNASGALQTGLRDNLAAVQQDAIVALIAACEECNINIFIQISATGASETASTEFFRTKAAADAALRGSALDWVVLKPGLVIARNAYGGTALIRMLAGMPYFVPVVLPDARLQTVSMDDVTDAVAAIVRGEIAVRTDFDLVEDESRSLLEIIRAFRRWMGLPDAPAWRLPRWFGMMSAIAADAAGWLGWRSPLRSTALKVLQNDVLGDPGPWRAASGKGLSSLEETLEASPSTMQERAFAAVQLLTSFVVCMLSVFFILSGFIGMAQSEAAAAVLENRIGEGTARALVYGGAVLDIALGVSILVRSWAKIVAGLMIALSFAYLMAGSVLTPHLWLDPLGPFLKVFPVMGLALCAMLMIEER